MKILFLALVIAVFGCGGEPPIEEPTDTPTQMVVDPPEVEDHCGNRVCEEDKGEDYWNCFDCVDPFTGAPKHGYCGDGICFNETMLSCFKDCRPRGYNSGGDDTPWPQPGGDPLPPIPLPDPGPAPDPGPMPGPKPFLNPGEINNANP